MASILNIRETLCGADQRELTGANSAAFAVGDLVTLASGFASKSTTTGVIVGSALEAQTFASDNQTVAKLTLATRMFNSGTVLQLTASADITKDDEGKFYNLTSGQLVDVATAGTVAAIVNTSDAGSATDPVVFKQLKLVKFLSARRGEFVVVTLGNA